VTCEKLQTPHGVVIVCSRGRRKPKCNCFDHAGKIQLPCTRSPGLQCDKCDRYVCEVHSVQVQLKGAARDFCARCFFPVWQRWVIRVMAELIEGTTRDQRRSAFRDWAAKHPAEFEELKLSKKAQAST
jgi:hypothetical protein